MKDRTQAELKEISDVEIDINMLETIFSQSKKVQRRFASAQRTTRKGLKKRLKKSKRQLRNLQES